MAATPVLENSLRQRRTACGWSQDELAQRSGISRAGISAIERGKLVPATAAALVLAAALGCHVEELFWLPSQVAAAPGPLWAWPAPRAPFRYWHANIGGRTRLYPVETSPLGIVPCDGIFGNETLEPLSQNDPARTLVLASCDPAAAVLAGELARHGDIRLIVVPRSSAEALRLLDAGLVHAAGVHLAEAHAPGGNAEVVRQRLGPGYRLLHVAEWEEGITFTAAQRISSVRQAAGSRLRWVGREVGSGARQCLDEVLEVRRPPRRLASDHRGVAEAVRSGWADLGVCHRLTSEEAGLEFLSIRREAYDLCFSGALQSDPRLQALIQTVRSHAYLRLLDALPGFSRGAAGPVERLA